MYYKSQTNDPTVCGIYIIAKPEQTVHVYFDYVDVPCNTGGLIAVSANERSDTYVRLFESSRTVPVRVCQTRACTNMAPSGVLDLGLVVLQPSRPNRNLIESRNPIQSRCYAGGGTHRIVVVRGIRSMVTCVQKRFVQRAGSCQDRRLTSSNHNIYFF